MLLQMEETYSENTTPTLLFWDCCEYNLRQNIQNGNIDSKISYFILREQRLPGKGAHSRPICNGTQTAAYAPGLHGRTSQPPEPPARDAKNRTANPARHAYPTTVFTFRRAPVRPSARRPTKRAPFCRRHQPCKGLRAFQPAKKSEPQAAPDQIQHLGTHQPGITARHLRIITCNQRGDHGHTVHQHPQTGIPADQRQPIGFAQRQRAEERNRQQCPGKSQQLHSGGQAVEPQVPRSRTASAARKTIRPAGSCRKRRTATPAPAVHRDFAGKGIS